MKKLFSNILVPVNVKNPSGYVIREALDLARAFECNVHLLFLLPKVSNWFSRTRTWLTSEEDIRQQVAKLYAEYSPLLPAPLRLLTSVQTGKQEAVIINYAAQHYIDLVVLGKAHPLFSAGWLMQSGINRLSKKTACPVLSLQSRANLDSLRNIVMPVGTSFLPIRKLMFATYLARKYNSRLHLVTLSGSHGEADPEGNLYLMKAYRLIRDNTEVPVECKTLPGQNIAAITLQYAKDVKAGLIVINPGSESLLSGFINQVFSRFLFNESRIPVMTISPPAR